MKYRDILGMYLIKVVAVAAPLILLPFLSRALNNTEFSLYLYTLVLVVIPSTIIEYGFNVSATRLVAQASSRESISQTVYDILSAKVILILPTLFICLAMYSLIDRLYNAPVLAVYVLVLGVLQGFNASWYFQGVGKILFASTIEAVINVSLASFTIFYLGENATIFTVLNVLLVFKLFHILLINHLMLRQVDRKRLTLMRGFDVISDTRPLVMRVGTLSYSYIAGILAGLILTTVSMSIFLIADKISKALISLIQPLSQILFPLMSKKSKFASDVHQKDVKMLLKASVLSSVTISGIFFVLAEVVILFFTDDNIKESVAVFRILVWQLPLAVCYEVIGVQYLLALGHFSKFTLSNFLGLLFFVGAWATNFIQSNITSYALWTVSSMAVTVLSLIVVKAIAERRKKIEKVR
jgi:polysaccharide transporter, PST family